MKAFVTKAETTNGTIDQQQSNRIENLMVKFLYPIQHVHLEWLSMAKKKKKKHLVSGGLFRYFPFY